MEWPKWAYIITLGARMAETKNKIRPGACMAVIWGTHNSMALNGLPGPIAIHLDVLPHLRIRILDSWTAPDREIWSNALQNMP